MTGKSCVALLFMLSALVGQAGAAGVVVRIYPLTTVGCHLDSIQAKFTAAKSTYRMSGRCDQRLEYENRVEVIPIPWTSEGAYAPGLAKVEETIMLNGNPPYRGKIQTRLACVEDPWLVTGKAACTQPAFSAGGEAETLAYLTAFLRGGFETSLKPNTTGFPYDRAALVAQRPKDLLAEQQAIAETARLAQEAARKEAQKLQQRVQPGSTLLENLAPLLVSPTAGSRYLSMTTVPIKLAPPPGRMTVTLYTVKIERKNPGGSWAPVTTLPIGLAQASSPSGYLGWGAGGPDGRSLSLMASPGTYRMTAQVSAPQQTGWSQGVEFVVMAPNNTIQRIPKSFGP